MSEPVRVRLFEFRRYKTGWTLSAWRFSLVLNKQSAYSEISLMLRRPMMSFSGGSWKALDYERA